MSLFNLATQAVSEVMNQLTPRYSVDTIARLSNEDRAYLHTARPTAMRESVQSCIRSVFLSNICLSSHVSKPTSSATRIWKFQRERFGRPRELRDAVEEDVLHTSATILTIFRQCRICSRPTTSLVNSLHDGTLGKNRNMIFFQVCSLHRLSFFYMRRNVQFTYIHKFHDWKQNNPRVVHRFDYQHRFRVNMSVGTL